MNIFNLKDRVINDYHQYIESFLYIRDERIRQFVNEDLSGGIRSYSLPDRKIAYISQRPSAPATT